MYNIYILLYILYTFISYIHRKYLEEYKRNNRIISGDWNERLERTCILSLFTIYLSVP